jgi:hypothetical protein
MIHNRIQITGLAAIGDPVLLWVANLDLLMDFHLLEREETTKIMMAFPI